MGWISRLCGKGSKGNNGEVREIVDEKFIDTTVTAETYFERTNAEIVLSDGSVENIRYDKRRIVR